MATKKYTITQLQEDNSLLELHPKTDADIVNVDNSSGKYAGNATNAQDAFEELYNIATASHVTDGTATIASESNGVVTIKSGLSQTNGTIANSSGSDIVLGTAAKKSVSTNVSFTSTDNELATAKAVYSAISSIPAPMIFKGSLGTDGTITTLPTASNSNIGYTYKVITAGTYANQPAKIGDIFISNGTAWELVPSGDEPNGTVTNVNAQGASGSHITVSGGPITTSGTLEINIADGYSIPSTNDQNGWNSKYAKPSGGIPKTDLASGVQSSLSKADSALQEHQTITASGDVSGTSSSTGAITLTLSNTGVTAGTYSAVSVDKKGRVTAGAQMLEVGGSSQTTPSSGLAVGGIFFKEI